MRRGGVINAQIYWLKKTGETNKITILVKE